MQRLAAPRISLTLNAGYERRGRTRPDALSQTPSIFPRPNAKKKTKEQGPMTNNKRYQVVIVGGGPVGVALAVELGLRGISCALVERRTELQRIPKGQNLTQRTLEHFYFWGVVDEMRAARLMPPGYPIERHHRLREPDERLLARAAAREIVDSYYFQDNERLPQYQMEEVLRTRMASLPGVESRFGWSATRRSSRTERRARHHRRGGRLGPRGAGGGLRGGLRRRPFARPRAGRHRARRRRFRPAHGAGGVPLARAAREASSASRRAPPIA